MYIITAAGSSERKLAICFPPAGTYDHCAAGGGADLVLDTLLFQSYLEEVVDAKSMPSVSIRTGNRLSTICLLCALLKMVMVGWNFDRLPSHLQYARASQSLWIKNEKNEH